MTNEQIQKFITSSEKIEDWLESMCRFGSHSTWEIVGVDEEDQQTKEQFIEELEADYDEAERVVLGAQEQIVLADGDVARVAECAPKKTLDGSQPSVLVGTTFHEVGVTTLLNFLEDIETARTYGRNTGDEIRDWIMANELIDWDAVERLMFCIRREQIMVKGMFGNGGHDVLLKPLDDSENSLAQFIKRQRRRFGRG